MRETYQKPQTEYTDLSEGIVLAENKTNLKRRRVIGGIAAGAVLIGGAFIGIKLGSEAGAESPQGTETTQEINDPMMGESYLTYDFSQGLDGYSSFEDFEAKYGLEDTEYGQQFLDTLKMVANYTPTDEEYDLWERHAENMALLTGDSYKNGDGARLFAKDFLVPLLKETYVIERDVPGIQEVYPAEDFFDEYVTSLISNAQYNQYVTRSHDMEPYQIEDISVLDAYYARYDMSVYSNQGTLLVQVKDNSHMNSMSKAAPYIGLVVDAGYDENNGKFGMSEVKFEELDAGDVEERLGYRPE